MPEFPSRLAGPQRGVGAGYAKNQEIAGAADPESAAAMASMDPTLVQEQLEAAEKANDRLNDLRANMLRAIESGEWTPASVTKSSPAEYAKYLSQLPPAQVEQLHAELVSFREVQLSAEEEQLIEEMTSNFTGIGPDSHLYDPLTDKERRKRIEDSVEEMDFEQMLFSGFCDQDVELRKSFVITMRTLSTQHGLWIEHMAGSLEDATIQYGRHWFSLMQLAACLQKINGKTIGPDLSSYTKQDQKAEFETALQQRMEYIGRLPAPVSDDLIVQYIWFTGRVRKMLAGDLVGKVGNS